MTERYAAALMLAIVIVTIVGALATFIVVGIVATDGMMPTPAPGPLVRP